MVNYLNGPAVHEAFFKKYQSKKMINVATFARKWIRRNWSEGASIVLEEELGDLRRMAESRRQDGVGAGQIADEKGVLDLDDA